MLERALDGDMAAAAANDHGELSFEVEVLRHRGADHFTFMADERVGEPNEHARLLGHLAPSLGGMRAIIYAGTENLFRVRDRRQPLDVAEPVVWFRRFCGFSHVSKRAGCERVAQARGAKALVQGDDAIAGHHAEARLATGNVARKLHFKAPFRATGSPAGNHIIPRPVGTDSCSLIAGP